MNLIIVLSDGKSLVLKFDNETEPKKIMAEIESGQINKWWRAAVDLIVNTEQIIAIEMREIKEEKPIEPEVL